MAPILRIVKLALGAVAGVLYLWFAGVRNAPAVKRRKASRRPRRPAPGARPTSSRGTR